MKELLVKVKWGGVAAFLGGILIGGSLTFGLNWLFRLTQPKNSAQPLVAGELVRHKLLPLDGLVLWNNEGPTVAIRWLNRKPHETGVWEDSLESEWERK